MKIRKAFQFLVAAFLLCGTMTSITSCKDDDDKGPDYEETYEGPDVPEKQVDPSEFQSIDVNVAILGNLSVVADMYAAEYWFKTVTNQVTDETQVVIANEITESNKADIAKVLGRFGLLLLIEPTEENVKKYMRYYSLEEAMK